MTEVGGKQKIRLLIPIYLMIYRPNSGWGSLRTPEGRSSAILLTTLENRCSKFYLPSLAQCQACSRTHICTKRRLSKWVNKFHSCLAKTQILSSVVWKTLQEVVSCPLHYLPVNNIQLNHLGYISSSP